MGVIADAMAWFTDVLTDASVTVVNDPRNVQPPAVLIDLPVIESLTGDVARLTIPVVVMAPPPGNLDSVTKLIELMDTVLAAFEIASVSTTTADPGIYQLGQLELPSYNIRATIAYRKD